MVVVTFTAVMLKRWPFFCHETTRIRSGL